MIWLGFLFQKFLVRAGLVSARRLEPGLANHALLRRDHHFSRGGCQHVNNIEGEI